MNEAIAKSARAGGRGARRALRSSPDLGMLPSLKRGLPECEPMTPDQFRQYIASEVTRWSTLAKARGIHLDT